MASVNGQFQPLSRFLEELHRLLAAYCREVFQKVIN